MHNHRPRGRWYRKGQSEVIGGLIVLTLLFAFAVPLLLNSYSQTVSLGEKVQTGLRLEKSHYNERITIESIYYHRPDIGVYINNTGTVNVVLDRMVLLDIVNHSIYKIIDLRTARPHINSLITNMLLNGGAPPPQGEPISLAPGDSLEVIFNKDIISEELAKHLVVLVISASGVLHPTAGMGAATTLVPTKGAGGAGGVGEGAWRGIYSPLSGFKLVGAGQLEASGYVRTWTPPLRIYPRVRHYSWWWSWWEIGNFSYYSSFIYNDPDFPGLYLLRIVPAEDVDIMLDGRYASGCPTRNITVYAGQILEVRGFIGTYDASRGTYFSGWAYGIKIYYSGGSLRYSYICHSSRNLGSSGVKDDVDFDGNGVTDLIVYSYLNGPAIKNRENINADGDYGLESGTADVEDSLVWTYMAARDISGVDYIKVAAKINYYWTTTFYSCPSWNTRPLKTFSIVIWKYDNTTHSWKLYQHQDYQFTRTKPKQYQPVIIFPVDRSGTYRVGVMFYDSYEDWYGYGYDCWTDFTYGLEHLIVEYGILNPLFKESPPVYLIAISKADLISGIGEQDFANATGSTIDNAKLEAQKTLLSYFEEELNYAGITGYTVIDNETMACNLLFDGIPPMNAIIIWLQGGNMSIGDAIPCVDDQDVYEFARDYHWVIVWPTEFPMGGATHLEEYNRKLNWQTGHLTANITSTGKEIRRKVYAYYLYDTLPFVAQLKPKPGWESLLVNNTDMYANVTDSGTWYTTAAFWLYESSGDGPGTGIIVANPVHIDWDGTGDGVHPMTAVQQTVYTALAAWQELINQYAS